MGKFVEKEWMCLFGWHRIPEKLQAICDQVANTQGTAIKERPSAVSDGPSFGNRDMPDGSAFGHTIYWY